MWSNEWTRDRYAKLSTGDHTAYDLAILTPPNGTNHPLWNAATKKLLGFPPSYTRHTITTAFHLAVGHAFISTYARRHRPDLPLESHRCPCGWWDRSAFHLVYDCPGFDADRLKTAHNLIWWRIHEDEFYGDVCMARILLDFLQMSRAVFRPETGMERPFDPGWLVLPYF